MRKICVVTGTRAEYGLLYWLIKEIAVREKLKLQLIVTGMHLSPEFGLTYRDIEKDFRIDKKIEMLLSSDTSVAISKSMGLAQISFAEAFDELKPDIVVVLGDRYEIFAAASASMIARIPIAHIHGGELTEGVVDDAIRHSITKMSHYHFAATEDYKQRIIRMGEAPDRVFNVGGLGLDSIAKLNLLSLEELEESLGIKLFNKNLLVTFHPATLEKNSAETQIAELLKALKIYSDIFVVFTKANADHGGRIINEMIDDYVKENKERSAVFVSLGQLRYLSLLKYIDGVVGNSSSGLLEVPSFKIGTVNIGSRQNGRIRAESVIDCKPEYNDIKEAIDKLFSDSFKQKLKHVKNPYGKFGASKKIADILEVADMVDVLKKKFYDSRVSG